MMAVGLTCLMPFRWVYPCEYGLCGSRLSFIVYIHIVIVYCPPV